MLMLSYRHLDPCDCFSLVSRMKFGEMKSLLRFYAPPQKGAGYYVIPSELLSVGPSVCPSVRPSAVEHSCPLLNFDTVQDNFTKLGTNINHDQTTCRD